MANWEAWLNGLYVYSAFQTVYANAWTKNSKAEYPSKPIPLSEADAKKELEEERRIKMEKLYAYMNKQMEKQKEYARKKEETQDA